MGGNSNKPVKSIKEILEQREANEYTVNPVFNIKKRTKVFIAEDIGDGDHSSLSCIPDNATGKVKLMVKQQGIIAEFFCEFASICHS